MPVAPEVELDTPSADAPVSAAITVVAGVAAGGYLKLAELARTLPGSVRIVTFEIWPVPDGQRVSRNVAEPEARTMPTRPTVAGEHTAHTVPTVPTVLAETAKLAESATEASPEQLAAALDWLADPALFSVAVLHAGEHCVTVPLALACDYLIAAETATVRLPGREDGLPPLGATFALRQRLGAGVALELWAAGRSVTGAEAVTLRLVDQVAAEDDLADRVSALSAEVLATDREVYAETKALLRPRAARRQAAAAESDSWQRLTGR